MWLKGTFTAYLETHNCCRRLFLNMTESVLDCLLTNLFCADWVLNFSGIPVPIHSFNDKYYFKVKNKRLLSNKAINPLHLATVGLGVLYCVNTFLYCIVRKVSSVPMIWAEACFVCTYQFFMDTTRELHRVKPGWLYSFSHLRRAPEEVWFCLLWVSIYWQQHLLWIFRKTFFMMNPTLYFSIRKRAAKLAFS